MEVETALGQRTLFAWGMWCPVRCGPQPCQQRVGADVSSWKSRTIVRCDLNSFIFDASQDTALQVAARFHCYAPRDDHGPGAVTYWDHLQVP